MTEFKALQNLENNWMNLTVAQAYSQYHKITGNTTVDVTYSGSHYGYDISNIYNQSVVTPKAIIKEAKQQIQDANQFKKDASSQDILTYACQQYYFWLKYSGNDNKHDGADEFRNLSKQAKVNKGYKLLIDDARKMIKRVQHDEKQGNGIYFNSSNQFLTVRYQTSLTIKDMELTINNALSQLIYKKIEQNKPKLLTPREAQAVCDVKFQHDLVKMNWADNWHAFGSPHTYEDMNLTKQRMNSIKNAYAILNFADFNNADIPTKDIDAKKVFKYNVKDAKKVAKANV